MATTITKNWISSDNNLFKARVKDGIEQIKIHGKWQNLTERGRYIKTKTLYVTFVNHKSGVSKSFKQGRRYQVEMTASLGQNAGKIFDEDGDSWTLIRSEDVGFTTVCGTYKFESQYK
ncbi:hypothetical protein FDI67_gp71 [Escherichia phage phiKP26]|uniref:Uncharacterized protein n=2 Tax=Rogunavirus TaxID=1920866 RepID=A0A0P0J045_9CAUD|nr:hypothetical protein FDI67_gp71 [Escherichia phage phiKP26]YP_009615887.1 hypothetical protein FDI75_gp52 [Escherichia phage C119]AGH25213.1 hypothetical protein kp_71 [Escherichia phage phiKP26]ALJ98932.1 hypothetical protein C119_52 [Escherichia phage C119]